MQYALLILYKEVDSNEILLDIGCECKQFCTYEKAEIEALYYPENKVIGGTVEHNLKVMETRIVEKPMISKSREALLLEFFTKRQLKRIERNLTFNRTIFCSPKEKERYCLC